MPDPSHRPYHPMTIIRPDSLPRFWWLFPWATVVQLHKAATAMKAYADRADRAIEMQIRIIDDYRAEAERQAHHINYLTIEADTDHARWLRVLEENEALRKKGAQS